MKKTFTFNKLVRSKLDLKMRQAGAEVMLKDCNEEELLAYFKLKIVEEAQEVFEAKTREDMITELADCLEVIRGFADRFNIGMTTIETVANEKLKNRGGFVDGVVIESVTLTSEDKFKDYVSYLESQPKKYPVSYS
jgi:predicted house-cleaning noncanonical NTP pyrophosphatase (MazG superfamily)